METYIKCPKCGHPQSSPVKEESDVESERGLDRFIKIMKARYPKRGEQTVDMDVIGDIALGIQKEYQGPYPVEGEEYPDTVLVSGEEKGTPIGCSLMKCNSFYNGACNHDGPCKYRAEAFPGYTLIPNAARVSALVNDPLRNEIWEYKEELKANGVALDTVDDLEKILEKTGKTVSAPVKEEPLEELAKRKGCELHGEINIIGHNVPCSEDTLKNIDVAIRDTRTYLSTLPDTKDEKEKK